MTTFENRAKTAVLVIDVQNGVVDGAYEWDAVVANVGTVVEKARAAGVRAPRHALNGRWSRVNS